MGADFAILNLRVVEGEGTVYAPGSRATRGITVEVTDETGRPLPGVTVSFQLPDEGPSGEFLNGGRSDVVTTQAEGRATIWGMRWNKSPGAVSVRITAAKDGVRAGTVSTQVLDPAVPQQTTAGVRSGKPKLLWITIAVAGAAAAGLAAGSLRGSKSGSQSTPVDSVTIGAPTVSIGAPQ